MLRTNRPTLAELSRQAKVSKSAVSAALSGRSSTIGVSDSTRRRILRIAEEMKYSPNILAKSLTVKKSYLIALLCRRSFDLRIADTIRGIQDIARQRNYSLVTYSHGDSVEDESFHLALSEQRQVDGMIVMPALEAGGRTSAEYFAHLIKKGVHVVQLFYHVLPNIPSLTVNHKATGWLATQHLIGLGHRRILHLTHDCYQDTEQPGFFQDARERWEGYDQCMRSAGLQPVVFTHPCPPSGHMGFFKEAYEAAERIVLHPHKPTAIVAYNDYEALGLVNALNQKGLRLPDDLSIVGFDNIEASQVVSPSLTTMAGPSEEFAQKAASMLFDLLDGKKVGDTVVTPDLITRASTAAPRSVSE